MRVLEPAEYGRLAGTPLEGCPADLPAAVVAVEREGRIVGTLLLGLSLHAEAVWIAPEARGRAAVARHLLRAMDEAAAAHGLRALVVGLEADDPVTARRLERWMIRRGGQRLPAMGLWPVGRRTRRP